MIGIQFGQHRLLRPVQWGFFISVFVLVLGIAYHFLLVADTRRSTYAMEVFQGLSETIQDRFDQEKERRLMQAQELVQNTAVVRGLKANVRESVAMVFDVLTRHQEGEMTIDIADANGSVVAWCGPEIVHDYREMINGEERDTITRVIFDELRTHLVVGMRVPEENLFVFVASPLEHLYPLSTPILSSASLMADLEREEGIRARLVPPSAVREPLPHYVPLRSHDGTVLAYASIVEPAENDIVEATFQKSSLVLRTGAALAALFAAMLGALMLRRGGSMLVRGLFLLLFIWGVRSLWIAIGFPAILFHSSVFDPRVYSSPFGFGLTATLGDLFLSVLALGLSVGWPLRMIVDYAESVLKQKRVPLLFAASAAVIVVLGICFLVRAYGASLRSFVFDSTIAFQDTTGLLPSLELVLVHLVILSLSLICIAVSVRVYGILLLLTSPFSTIHKATFLLSTTLVGWLLFILLDRQYHLPPAWLFILLVTFLGGSVVVSRGARFSVIISTTVFLSLLLSLPLLDRRVHEKEREQIHLRAEELLQPSDSWLSLVAEHSLRQVQQEYASLQTELSDSMVVGGKLAFRLWAKTPLSQRDYNSIIVVYANDGHEVSRFAVGLASYEQSDLLRSLFEGDEERVYTLSGYAPEDRYYGIWGTMRDENNEVLGYVALILSKPERDNVSPNILLTSATGTGPLRKSYIVRYFNGSVVETNVAGFYVGMQLSQDIRRELERNPGTPVWKSQTVGSRSYEIMYLQNTNTPAEVIAILSEELDLRWHAFHVLKVLIVYIGVLIVIAGAMAVRYRDSIRFGFRERLLAVLGFAIIVPMGIMLLYNQSLIEERAHRKMTLELERQLTLVEAYVQSALSEEEDFYRGVTDDFCTAGARVLGIEFTVYRGNVVHASSRRDLYDAGILGSRLSGRAFANCGLLGMQHFEETEKVGELTYAAGYRPVMFNGRMLGVLSVSTLHREQEIRADIFEWNAFGIVVGASVLVLILGLGLVLAHRLSYPLRILRAAANEVGKGKLDVVVPLRSKDEVGEVVQSFNEMVERLRKSRDELARVERELAWKEMAKQVAHEIKNPLTPMKLSLQHLQQAYRDKAPDFDFIIRTVTETIIEQIDTLARIATEFSNFARMPARRFARVDLHSILEETVFLFKNVQGVEFRVNFSDTKPTIVADRDELRRVFVNILRNSIQAMETGGVITISTRTENGRCVIAISDTGPGIPESLRDQVFRPNFSTKTDGMGLGLAIARKIIEDLSGSITLEGPASGGTTVLIQLPLHA